MVNRTQFGMSVGADHQPIADYAPIGPFLFRQQDYIDQNLFAVAIDARAPHVSLRRERQGVFVHPNTI